MTTLLMGSRRVRISYKYVPQFLIEVRQVVLQTSQLIRKIFKRLFSRDQPEWPPVDINHRRKLKDDNQKESSVIRIQLAGNFAQRKVIQHCAYLLAAYRNNSIPLSLTSIGICSFRNLHRTKQSGGSMHRLSESNYSDGFSLRLCLDASFVRCSDLSLNGPPSDNRGYERHTCHYDVARKSQPVGGPNIVFENEGHPRRQKCCQDGRKRNNPDGREAWKVVSLHGANLPRPSVFVERAAA